MHQGPARFAVSPHPLFSHKTEPEQYRARLLALIADQARAIQQNFATRAIIIDGLQNPVVVPQIDDSNVELFVEYQLSATLHSR